MAYQYDAGQNLHDSILRNNAYNPDFQRHGAALPATHLGYGVHRHHPPLLPASGENKLWIPSQQASTQNRYLQVHVLNYPVPDPGGAIHLLDNIRAAGRDTSGLHSDLANIHSASFQLLCVDSIRKI